MSEIVQDAIHLQQGTDEWKQAKLGHVSASSVGNVLAKGRGGAESITRHKYKLKLAAERLTGQVAESYSNEAMAWGVENEPYARMMYEAISGNFVDTTGFWKHPSIRFVGVSPDGLIGHDGLIEIKCPNSTTHIDYLCQDRIPPEYYDQIQCQLWVTNREWCDFVSFDPRMPEHKKVFIKRCYRSNDFISDMEVAVVAFLKEVDQLIIKLGE